VFCSVSLFVDRKDEAFVPLFWYFLLTPYAVFLPTTLSFPGAVLFLSFLIDLIISCSLFYQQFCSLLFGWSPFILLIYV